MVKNSFSDSWKFWIWHNVKNGVAKGVLKEILLDHEFNMKIIDFELYPEILEHVVQEDILIIPEFEHIHTEQTEEIRKAADFVQEDILIIPESEQTKQNEKIRKTTTKEISSDIPEFKTKSKKQSTQKKLISSNA